MLHSSCRIQCELRQGVADQSRDRPGAPGLLCASWRRFDPSSSPSAIDQGSLLSSAVEQPQNPQQTETFQVNDRTGDYRRDRNLRRDTTFF